MKLKDSINSVVNGFKGLVSSKSNVRKDGWSNIFSNLNTSKSRSANTYFVPDIKLSDSLLTAIYNSDGIARRVVNIIVDDALRGFIECDQDLMNDLKRLKFKQRVIEGASFGRLYGGCVLVAFVDDGQELDKPLNINNIKKVVSLRAYDKSMISWTTDDLSINFYEEHFGEPDYFTITPPNSTRFRVHRSRCYIFGGEKTSLKDKVSLNKGWDNSVLQAVYESLRNYGSAMGATSEIIQDFIQTVISVEGLQDMLRFGEDELIKKRMEINDLSRSVSNTILLDAANEKYDKKGSSVGGLAELIDRNVEHISAVTGIPVTRLSGRSSGGLNASGESDIGNWHDIVEAYRADEIEPVITWLINLLSKQKLWTKRPAGFEWSFPSLKTPNELEWANIKQITAKTDEIYLSLGAIDPAELIKKRFQGGVFNTEISLDEVNEVETAIEVEADNLDLIESPMTASDELIMKVKELL